MVSLAFAEAASAVNDLLAAPPLLLLLQLPLVDAVRAEARRASRSLAAVPPLLLPPATTAERSRAAIVFAAPSAFFSLKMKRVRAQDALRLATPSFNSFASFLFSSARVSLHRAFQPTVPHPCMRQRSISLLLANMRASIPKTTTMSGASASSSSAAAASGARSASAAAAFAGASFLRKPLLSIGGRPRPYATTTSRISIASPLSVRASADSRRSLAAEAAAVSVFESSCFFCRRSIFPMLARFFSL